ncbi:MAG TPA: hypothetical protein VFX50_04755 [Gemmatimonadales bacterium]|nr:hypothetical protein [Gemmatimonadales bacterium]
MFIELTDHLRCPAAHDESFVVLLPDEVVGRYVRAGQLGCPACGKVYRVEGGVLDMGDAPPVAPDEAVPDAEALAALVGLGGPGGFLVLAGSAAARAADLVAALPGVHVAAVNPPAGVQDGAGVSVLRASRLPVRSASMRAVVLGAPFGADEAWQREAARAVLPGLRVVGQGGTPTVPGLALLAEAEGWWVAQRVAR